TITGSLTFTNRTVGERSARVVGAQGVTVFLGSGPALLPSGAPNPLAVGVLLSNATIGLVEFTDGTGGWALVASGTVSLVGVAGVTVSGTTSVRLNTTQDAITGESLPI